MRFLPWIEGQQFLIIYPLYGIFLLLLLVLLCKGDKGDYTSQNINEDEYFILTSLNRYNSRSMVRYFTFKLLSKGYIKSLDSVKGAFISIEKKSMYDLNMIERLLFIQYKDGKSLNNITVDSELNKELMEFYHNGVSALENKGIIQEASAYSRKRRISNILMIALIVPGVWRFVGGINYGMPSTFLIYEVIGASFVYFFISRGIVGDRITKIGRESMRYYRESYRRSFSTATLNNIDFESDDVNSSEFAAYFLLFGYGSDFFGPVIHNGGVGHSSGGGFYNSCSSCTTSSCSSCSSDSDGGGSSCSSCSGSSCSSCGGGCGGCGGGSD
ncbi:MAG: hypothetical protein ACRC2K_07835 [Clostridium sp.]